MHKKIQTTAVKAKAVRPVAERLITFAKNGTLHDRRQVLRTIRDKQVVKELFEQIAPVYVNRTGGYTRIVKLGLRQGDGAEVAYLELVDFEGVRKEKKEKKKPEREKGKRAEKTVEDTEEADDE
jgi:large subunit ribosomal protein L17